MISVEFPKVSCLPLTQKQLKTYSNSLDSHQKTMRNFLGGVAMYLSLNMNKFDQLVYPVGKQLFKVNKKVLINIYRHYFGFFIFDYEQAFVKA